MKTISERVLDVKGELCLCFIYWQKAFDWVYWTELQKVFKNIGVNSKEHRLICNLYMGQTVKLLFKGKLIMWTLEEKSDMYFACYPCYLTYMENI